VGVSSKWPKTQAPLTREQEAAWEDFFTHWHEVLPRRYGLIERFNHSFPMRCSRAGFRETIEVGAGLGGHLAHERLSPEEERRYCVVELRDSMAAQIGARYPHVTVIVGDCQERLPLADGSFDRYIAVHVLEHLPNLPACVREAWRLLDKGRGQLLAVIPCEGGLAYSLARRLSAKRIFERRYGIPYEPLIKREHLNLPREVLAELDPYFVLERRRLFPLAFLPLTAANLCIGLALRPRPHPLGAPA
jgi:SAM-dependent methyltransferase